MKIQYIAAYYRNDQPGGIGIEWHGDIDETWRAATAAADQGWQDESAAGTLEEMVRVLIAQIERVAAGKPVPGTTWTRAAGS